jgi:hypothetical protein
MAKILALAGVLSTVETIFSGFSPSHQPVNQLIINHRPQQHDGVSKDERNVDTRPCGTAELCYSRQLSAVVFCFRGYILCQNNQ